ncbi:hypothetical protein RhiirA5_405326 [Rhizophagus irregularis]|uniref:Uncharacterized protein n=1 Tax=Rhizophagus irregularis TaxID=588596 RepID=A0A2N0S587_9GLOM|nr:hypothetical protein RhiirA5_405326 [Rhizophagus irregularis]PKC70701.1 hypothetical protein RhiirA1_454428 [Rhizophagus irregularis]
MNKNNIIIETSEDENTSKDTIIPNISQQTLTLFDISKDFPLHVKITSEGNVKMTNKKTEQDLIKIDQLPYITDNNTFKNSFKEKYNKIEDDLK